MICHLRFTLASGVHIQRTHRLSRFQLQGTRIVLVAVLVAQVVSPRSVEIHSIPSISTQHNAPRALSAAATALWLSQVQSLG